MKRCILTILSILLAGIEFSAGESVAQIPLSIPRVRTDPGLYQRESLARLSSGSFTPVDSLSILVVRVSFSDKDFGIGADGNPHDSLYFENELRHLREYYDGASLSRFTLDVPLHPEVVPLSREEGYYGEDGEWEIRVSEMVMEIVEAIDDIVDFSQYEGIAFIHSSSGQETDFSGDSPYQLWSGFLDPEEMAEAIADTLGTPGVPTNDLIGGETCYIDNAIVWPAQASQDGYIFGSLGIYAYQIGLRIGMIPLFDTTPGSFPDSQGIGSFGLMGYGLYNAAGFIPAFPCAFHRYLMGWVQVIDIEADAGIRIKDINAAEISDTSLVRLSISPYEYFLVANRVHDKNFNGLFDFIDLNGNGFPESQDTLLGAEFDFFLTATTNPDLPGGGVDTGSGLLIWHIDEGVILGQMAAGGYPNDDASLKGVDLEEADGIQDLDRLGGSHSFGSYIDSFREGVNTMFGPETNPWSRSNSGIESGILIDGISAPGEYMDCEVILDVPGDAVRVDLPGHVGALSPIAIDYYSSGCDLVAAVDTGFVLYASNVGSADWAGEIDTILSIPGAVWSGPPIACNPGVDGRLGIFITTSGGMFYAFHTDGTPCPVGDPSALGSLRLEGDLAAAPIAAELDGDIDSEVILLSSDADSTFLYIVGFSGSWAGSCWETAGTGVIRCSLMEGRLLSHPAWGGITRIDGTALDYEGLFVAVLRDERDLYVDYIPLLPLYIAFEQRTQPMSRLVGTPERVPRSLCTPAAGAIHDWYDWGDVGVFTIEGVGLVYFNPFEDFHVIELEGAVISPPVLADLDQDGAMETVLRDRYDLYIFQGFGVPATEWPKKVPEALLDLEHGSVCASPIISDLDADDTSDVIFRVGGDLYAFSLAGSLLESWPIPGEGRSPSTPMLTETEDEGLYLFVAGSYDRLGDTGMVTSSALRRQMLPEARFLNTSWPFFRHDFLGSSRQARPMQIMQYGDIDERSFICYPNPAKGPYFTVRVSLPDYVGTVEMTLVNLEGEVVYSTTRSHESPSGSLVPFEARISTEDIAPGIYMCRLVARGSKYWEGVKKVAVIK